MCARGIGVRASKRKRARVRVCIRAFLSVPRSLAHTPTRVYGRESAGKATPDRRKRARGGEREGSRIEREKEWENDKKKERKREKESERGPGRKRVEDRTRPDR